MNSVLNTADKEAFLFFNRGHSQFIDQIMYSGRNMLLWLPLFLVCSFILFRYRKNRTRPHVLITTIIFFLFILFQLTISEVALPPLLETLASRERPAYNSEINQVIDLNQFSFTTKIGFFSSKICAVLSICFFLLAFSEIPKWLKFSLVLWALLISYNRIFIGAYYPANVLISATIGICIGLLMHRYYKYLKEDVLVI